MGLLYTVFSYVLFTHDSTVPFDFTSTLVNVSYFLVNVYLQKAATHSHTQGKTKEQKRHTQSLTNVNVLIWNVLFDYDTSSQMRFTN